MLVLLYLDIIAANNNITTLGGIFIKKNLLLLNNKYIKDTYSLNYRDILNRLSILTNIFRQNP